MMTSTVLIRIDAKTRDYIMNECREEYLRHHPEMQDIKLSLRFMVKQIADHYVRSW